jgi:alpha-glucosidase
MTTDTQRATLTTDVMDVLQGHGFSSTLEGQNLTLPAYEAFYALLS